MISVSSVLAAVLALAVITCGRIRANPSAKPARACDGLASYQLTLNTLWSRETFESQYPLYRPAAQWSKLIGRSHSGRYTMWSEGKTASEALKEFSEDGRSNGFDTQSQGSKGIYDAFIGPNIPTGVGTSNVKFLVHPTYHKLSFVARMIPSPDWFVGVDSIDLCTDNGQWKSKLTFDLHPVDAGTDRGFTFTSPKWPENPPKPIHIITSKYPNHPASSFYNPELASLPPIAKLQLTKVDFAWEETMEDTQEAHDQGLALSNPAAVRGHSTETEKTTSETETEEDSSVKKNNTRNRTSSGNRQMRDGRTRLSRSNVVPEKAAAAKGQPVDCEVSSWSDWSPCSKTCGFGLRVRTRGVIRRPTNRGYPCPVIREEQMCGSMRTCGWQYFSRSNRSPPADSQG